MSPDELDVGEVLKHMRDICGDKDQQIAMLRAALAKATRPPDTTPAPPTPTD